MPLSPTEPSSGRTPDPAFTHKRSLIGLEKNRIDNEHWNYYYHRYAANMNVLPASTGNDPLLENLAASIE